MSAECKRCHGTGEATAASSAGRRGGKGGQMLTAVPCPDCAPAPPLSLDGQASSALGRFRTVAVGELSASFEDGFIAGYLARDKEKP